MAAQIKCNKTTIKSKQNQDENILISHFFTHLYLTHTNTLRTWRSILICVDGSCLFWNFSLSGLLRCQKQPQQQLLGGVTNQQNIYHIHLNCCCPCRCSRCTGMPWKYLAHCQEFARPPTDFCRGRAQLATAANKVPLAWSVVPIRLYTLSSFDSCGELKLKYLFCTTVTYSVNL